MSGDLAPIDGAVPAVEPAGAGVYPPAPAGDPPAPHDGGDAGPKTEAKGAVAAGDRVIHELARYCIDGGFQQNFKNLPPAAIAAIRAELAASSPSTSAVASPDFLERLRADSGFQLAEIEWREETPRCAARASERARRIISNIGDEYAVLALCEFYDRLGDVARAAVLKELARP